MKIRKEEVLYFIYFIILETGISIWSDTQSNIFRIMIIFACMILLMKIFMTKYTLLEKKIFFVALSISILVTLVTRRITAFLTVFTLLGMKNINIDKILKVSLIIRSFVFLGIIISNHFGLISVKYYEAYRENILVQRTGLGYPHPNMCQLAFCILVILFIYVFYKKYNILFASVILMINYQLYQFTYSRTSYYTCIFICLFAFVLKNKFFIKRKNKFLIWIIPISYIFTILITIFYKKYVFIKNLDKLLSSRILLSNYYLNKYGINLFGTHIRNESNALDSGLLTLLINYGLIYTLAFIIIMMIVNKKMIAIKNYKVILLTIGFLTIGLTESITPIIFTNLSLLLIGEYIYNINEFKSKRK